MLLQLYLDAYSQPEGIEPKAVLFFTSYADVNGYRNAFCNTSYNSTHLIIANLDHTRRMLSL